MAVKVNIWLGLRQAAHDTIRNELILRLTSDVERESTIPEWVAQFFLRGAKDWRRVRPLYNSDRVWFTQGAVWRTWHLWSLTFKVDNLQQLNTVVQRLLDEYPSMVKLVGAWKWDGTQLVAPDPRIAKFLPNETRTDVNVVFGQNPRDFSA